MRLFIDGAPFRDTDAAAAIDRLFATAYYDDMEIDVQPERNRGRSPNPYKRARFTGHYVDQGSIKEPPNRPGPPAGRRYLCSS